MVASMAAGHTRDMLTEAIMRDPEDDWVNCGTYRVMVHDAKRVGVWMSPGKQGRRMPGTRVPDAGLMARTSSRPGSGPGTFRSRWTCWPRCPRG